MSAPPPPLEEPSPTKEQPAQQQQQQREEIDAASSSSSWWIDFVAGWFSGAVSIVLLQPVDTILTRWQAGVLITNPPSTPPTTTVATATAAGYGPARHVNVVASEAKALITSPVGLRSLWRGSYPMISAVPFQNALLMGGYGIGQNWYDNKSSNNSEEAPGGTGGRQQQQQQRYAAIFIGGGVGGVLQSFLMSPVELIKVNQQCRTTADYDRQQHRVLGQLLVRDGPSSSLLALWTRGLGATILRDGIPHGVWFGSYEACKQFGLAYYGNRSYSQNQRAGGCADINSSSVVGDYHDDCDYYNEVNDNNMPVAVPLLSGAVAATVAWGVGYPADLIKTRLQYNAASSAAAGGGGTGIIGMAKQLIREANGSVIDGLYRGFGIKLVRAIPASMVGFVVYEYVKSKIILFQQQQEL